MSPLGATCIWRGSLSPSANTSILNPAGTCGLADGGRGTTRELLAAERNNYTRQAEELRAQAERLGWPVLDEAGRLVIPVQAGPRMRIAFRGNQFFGPHALSGHDQIAFILAVFVIDDHGHLAAA